METVICFVCDKKFVKKTPQHRFCSYSCHKAFQSLPNRKELMKLTQEERDLREKILRKLGEQNDKKIQESKSDSEKES